VALPGNQHERIMEIATRCQDRDIRLRVVPDLFDVVMIRATLTEIDDIPLIGLRDPVITGYQSLVKRVFDLLVAAFLLVLSAPLFVLVPLAILWDSRGRGPVFFVQQRVGENGRLFCMYKFRSMVPDAPERLAELVDLARLPEPVYKLPRDPRVTRVGRWLRRTSLDELPQLINVLVGDMSLVGPRPERPPFVRQFRERIPQYMRRHRVKSGMTGWAQVNGWRGNTSIEKRIEYDLYYIGNWSLRLDLKIMWLTVVNRLFKHAY
jgi:exopolysaccharide biosynthesis polyprenyl glycosylphosphotransferase